MTATPKAVLTGSLTTSATATDVLSGIAAGEYFIDTDPGIGNGKPMAYDSTTGKITATAHFAPGSLSTGRHNIKVRAEDRAGNWSTVATSSFTYIR